MALCKKNVSTGKNAGEPEKAPLLLRIGSLGLILWSLFVISPLLGTVHADGGAPNLAYVAGGGKGVSVIDIGQQKVTRDIPLDGVPSMIYLTLDGRYLFAVQPGANKVTKLQADSGKTVCTSSIAGQPSLIEYDTEINVLYVASNHVSGITAIDGNTCKIKNTIPTSGPVFGMKMAIVSPGVNGADNNQLWYTTESALNIFTLSGTARSIAIPAGPQYITIPPGATVYITTRQGTVLGISLQTFQVTDPLLSDGDFGPMDFDDMTEQVYIPDKKHNQIDVLAPIFYGSSIPKEPDHTIKVQSSPQSVAITSDGNLAFFVMDSGKVEMYDIPGKAPITNFSIGGEPHFVISGLYPPTPQNGNSNNGSNLLSTILIIVAIAAFAALAVIVVLLILARRKQGDDEEIEYEEEDM